LEWVPLIAATAAEAAAAEKTKKTLIAGREEDDFPPLFSMRVKFFLPSHNRMKN